MGIESPGEQSIEGGSAMVIGILLSVSGGLRLRKVRGRGARDLTCGYLCDTEVKE